MNVNDLTLGQIKQLQSMFNNNQTANQGLNSHIGEKVIVRTYSAGVWFGELIEKSGTEVILKDARRMWYWKANKSISLSGVAVYGISSESNICPRISRQWLDAIEIISCTDVAIKSIEDAPDVEAV